MGRQDVRSTKAGESSMARRGGGILEGRSVNGLPSGHGASPKVVGSVQTVRRGMFKNRRLSRRERARYQAARM